MGGIRGTDFGGCVLIEWNELVYYKTFPFIICSNSRQQWQLPREMGNNSSFHALMQMRWHKIFLPYPHMLIWPQGHRVCPPFL
jgi:hypothetical protein